jgi:hypothetical protein
MPDLVFGGLELAADLTVSGTAYAPAEDGQPGDLASLTEATGARWYQGAGLSMIDAYDLADTMGECADGRCSPVRIALGLLPVIPGKAATKLFNHFTPIERLVPIARKVAGDIDQMHWIPKQFHAQVQARWASANAKLLNFSDPLLRDFHKIVHGKWGTRLEEYTAQVNQWLQDPSNQGASLDTFLDFIEQQRLQYMEHYSQYLTGG